MKKIIITGFMFYGIAVGLIAVWFRQNTDTLFLVNIPGSVLGDAVYVLSIRFFGDPHASQAHYTIPWVFRIPQVYVTVSMLFWGLIGSILGLFLKARMVAWIMGIYLVVFGSFYCLASLRLF